MTLNTKQHPADRMLMDAFAHTIREGGLWVEGPPKTATYHTVLYADGWAYDTTLGKQRTSTHRVEFMPVFVDGESQPIVPDVKYFDPPAQAPIESEREAALRRGSIEHALEDIRHYLDRLERDIR
jgi:hypothetical protein